ncbi:MAG: hypothetical protein HN919_11030, partial [Verrucomicrobia bacterium]|nr:hypothetical protein [Verrucomicrobiota bacterium]
MSFGSIWLETDEGIGQYDYIEKDAATYIHYGVNWASWNRSEVWVDVGGSGAAYSGSHIHDDGGDKHLNTGNVVSGNHGSGWAAGNGINVYCRIDNDGSDPWNEESSNLNDWMIFDVIETDVSGTIGVGEKQLVLQFRMDVGSNAGRELKRLWVHNSGSLTEDGDILTVKLYYENGSILHFDGDESSASFGAGGGAGDEIWGSDSLNISIPTGSDDLCCYVVIDSWRASPTIGNTAQFEIISDGISLDTFGSTSKELARIDVTQNGTALTLASTWDGGDGSDNNFGSGDNWVGNSAPSVGTGSDLYFTGSTRTSPYNNYTAYNAFRSIYFASGASSFSITGNSIDWHGIVQNNDDSAQILNLANLSMKKSGGGALNPVAGDLTIGSDGGTGDIHNDTDADLHVYGDNGHTLTLGMDFNGDTSADLQIHEYSEVKIVAAQSYQGLTKIDEGELWIDTNGSLNGGAIHVGSASAPGNYAKLYIVDPNGGTTLDENIVVNSGDSGSRRIVGGGNTSGTNTYSGTLSLSDDAGIEKSNSEGTIAFSGVVSGDYDLTKYGSGTAQFTGQNTFGSNSTLYIDNGTWEVAPSSGTDPLDVQYIKLGNETDNVTLKLSGTQNFTLDSDQIEVRSTSGTKMIQNAEGANTISSALLLSAVLVEDVASGTTLTQSGAISGGSGPTKTGDGTLRFAGSTDNAYSGATTVSGGSLILAKDAGKDAIPDDATINSGATVQLEANNQIVNTSFVTVDTGGTLDLNGKNDAMALQGAGSITLGGGSLTITNTGTGDVFSGIISEGGTVSKKGSGTQVLSGVNEYTGATTVGGGTLRAANNSALGTVAGGVTISDGATLSLSNNITVGAEVLSLDGTAPALENTSGDNVWQGAVTLAGDARANSKAGTELTLEGVVDLDDNTLYVGDSGDTVISGAIANGSKTTDNGALYKDGTGALTLSGANGDGLTGTVNLVTGALLVGHDSALASGGTVVLSGGTTLAAADGTARAIAKDTTVNGDITLGQASGGTGRMTLSGDMALGGANRILTLANATNEISGEISGGGGVGLVKRGDGTTLELSGDNTFAGALYIDAGTIDLSGGSLGAGVIDIGTETGGQTAFAAALRLSVLTGQTVTQPVTAKTGGTRNLLIENTSGLTECSGDVTLDKTLTVTKSGGAATVGEISGAIDGSGGITKAGNGILELSAANSYGGPTTITAGTLLYSGTNTNSSVSVPAESRLFGAGSIGATTVNGTIGAGNATSAAVGILDVTAVNLQGGGTAIVDIVKAYLPANSDAGDDYDQVRASGAITVGASEGTPFTIKVVEGASSTFDNTKSYSWTIFTGASMSGFAEAKFTIDTNSWSSAVGTGGFTLRQYLGDIYLEFDPADTGTFEWDAGAGTGDRDWSNATNWQANLEPGAADTPHINGGYTAVVSLAEQSVDLCVGDANDGTGTVRQVGGSLTLGDELFLGKGQGDVGRYTITNGTLTVADRILVGDRGVGELTLSDAAEVIVQGGASTDGIYIGDGSATLAEDAGSFFQQDGGTATTHRITIGVNAGSSGSYAITGGKLAAADTFLVAWKASCSGTVSIAGGTVEAERMELGGASNAMATLTLSGGTLHMADDGGSVRLSVGYGDGSTGVVNQSGGTLSIDPDGDLVIGGEAGTGNGFAVGSYAVSNGTMSVGRDVLIGPEQDADTGYGTLHVQGTNASITAGNDFKMQSSNATYQVTLGQGGVSTIVVTNSITLDGTITIGKDASFVLDQVQYVLMTNSGSTISGEFDVTNFVGMTTGTVTKTSNAVLLNFPVTPPSDLTAVDDGPEGVTLGWSQNGDSDDVMIVWRSTNAPAAGPTNGQTYAAGSDLGGGKVIFNSDSGTRYFHVELEPATTNFYDFYSMNQYTNYSAVASTSEVTEAFYVGEIVDAFSYTIGDALHGKTGGQGWTNAWAETASGKFVSYEHTFSNFSGYLPNHGHKSGVVTDGSQEFRAQRGFEPFTNGAIYASYIMNYKRGWNDSYCGMSFMHGANELAFIGKAFTSHTNLSMDVDGTYVPSTYVLKPLFEQDYIIFCKYDFDTYTFSTRAYYIGNQTVPTREPVWEISHVVASDYVSQIDGIRFASGKLQESAFFDEVRVARSWNGLLNNLIAYQGFEWSGDDWPYALNKGDANMGVVSDRKEAGGHSLWFQGSTNESSPEVTLTNLSLSGYSNVVLSIAYSANGPDDGDTLSFQVNLNGGGFNEIGYVAGHEDINFAFGGIGYATGTATTVNPFIYEVPSDTMDLQFRIVYNEESGVTNDTDYWYIDDIKVTGQSSPEIEILGTNLSLVAAGSTTVDVSLGTDFGGGLAGVFTNDHTFTVTNRG